MSASLPLQSYGIGQSARRVEDIRFLTGRGRFTDDIGLTHQCYAIIVLSPHAHARIRAIDTASAKAAFGVVCVLTGDDVKADKLGGILPNFMPEDAGGPKGYRTRRPILVDRIVRHVGDRVAMVVAETLAQAREAADLIKIDYEPLPAVVNIEDAVKPGAPSVWDECKGNVSFTLEVGNKEATDKAFAQAAHRVSLRLENNRLAPNAMEPRVALGDYDPAEETYTLHTSSQAPHAVRSHVASHVFGLPEGKFRVIAPDVGGGFGVKADAYPEDALVLWASRRCGRPVKWTGTRADSILGDNHARDQVVQAELALDAKGKILAVRAHALHAFGSYIMSAAVAPLLYSLRYTPGAYDIQTLHLSTKGVFTHTSPLGVYRGAGRPEGNYVIERLLDRAAVEMGIGPDEIRRRNFINPQAMPYTTPTGSVYDSGEFERLMDECMKLGDWQGYKQRQKASKDAGKVRGRSVSYYIEHAGIFNERMEMHFDPSGTLTILAGTHSHGQGHATTFPQLVSDFLGIPFEQIRYVQGDTDKVPFGRGTYAARSAVLGGSALKLASDILIDTGKKMAAHMLEAAATDIDFEHGHYKVRGTDKRISLTDVAKAHYRPVLPPDVTLGLEASASFAGDNPSYPNGCHVCEVELDPATGEIRLDRYTVVDDCGLPINPMICEGQIQGGLAQGIGQALMENVVYDRESGQLLTGSYMDYAMPRADDMGELTTTFSNVPCKTNPIGIKGVGESGTIGAPSAVMNAVIDALRSLGIDHIDMPVTPYRVWQALQRHNVFEGVSAQIRVL
ncbi:MAG TPA: xanthine dehydrogenase family protein molybdopterin-binding subunit [Xanthobacteraceae bacterium]|nr:xanthine dehydrogenase family protein molybdopterin-binding subunit [Xanthobacteraceae bacterium]